MDSIDERLKTLIDRMEYKPQRLADETGMSLDRWKAFYYGRVRAAGDHIEAAAKLWPQFAYWITTGQTLPSAGQISPEIEEARSNSEKGSKATG